MRDPAPDLVADGEWVTRRDPHVRMLVVERRHRHACRRAQSVAAVDELGTRRVDVVRDVAFPQADERKFELGAGEDDPPSLESGPKRKAVIIRPECQGAPGRPSRLCWIPVPAPSRRSP